MFNRQKLNFTTTIITEGLKQRIKNAYVKDKLTTAWLKRTKINSTIELHKKILYFQGKVYVPKKTIRQ